MKTLIITGAYGMLGTNICNTLKQDYPDIKVVKIKFDSFPKDFNGERADFIIHASGYGQPAKFMNDEIKTIEVNTHGTISLLNWLKMGGKFLYISTSEVYSGLLPPHNEEEIGTTSPQHPRASYIESKRCGEAICMAYKRLGFDTKIARLALSYGPGYQKGDTRVLHSFVEQSMKHDIILKDSGDARRTYLYVGDAVKMLLNVLFNGTQSIYNIGGISDTTIKELALTIARKQGYGIVVGKVNKPLIGAPDNVKLDISRYENEFGKVNFVSLSEGIDKTIEWQKSL